MDSAVSGHDALVLKDWHDGDRYWIVPNLELDRAKTVSFPDRASNHAKGWFASRVHPSPCALYLHDGAICIDLGAGPVKWDAEGLRVSRLACHMMGRAAVVMTSGIKVKAAFTYKPVAEELIESGVGPPTSIAEEETLDWWLWLSRLSQKKRLNIQRLLVSGI